MASARKIREDRASLFRAKLKERYRKENQEWLEKVKAYDASKCIGGGCGCGSRGFCSHKHLETLRSFPREPNPKRVDRARGKMLRKKRTGKRK